MPRRAGRRPGAGGGADQRLERRVLVPVSNTGCDRDTLEDRVLAAVDGQPAVVFVDLASGSCLVAVLKRLRSEQLVKVVTGVNLAMLVDFVFHRSLSPAEAAARAAAAGREVDQDSLMAIVLCRIDDRLIHGQVVIGWGRAMGIDLIILVDDQVAASEWEQELYRMAVTPEIEVSFVTMADAARQMSEWQANGKRGLGADRRPRDHGRAARLQPRGGAANQSGRNPPPGRPPRASAVHLSDRSGAACAPGARGRRRRDHARRICPPRLRLRLKALA